MRMWSRRSKALAAGLAAALGVGLMSGARHRTPAGRTTRSPSGALENLTARMAATKKTVAAFEKKSGVQVDLVGVDEGQLPQLIMSAAAAGTLPDVIGWRSRSGQAWQMYTNGLLNTEAPDEDRRRSWARHLQRQRPETDRRRSHPSRPSPATRGRRLLVYRKDLFAEAGLPEPDTYAACQGRARS